MRVTHHLIYYQLLDVLDEHLDPLLKGLWVDHAGERANDRAPRALFWVDLEEVEHPKQMLWTALLGKEVVLIKQPPKLVNDKQACPKELAEVPHLQRRGSNGAGRPVLDVPGRGLKFRHAAVDVLIVIVFIVAVVVFDYHCGHGEGGGGSGGRGGGG